MQYLNIGSSGYFDSFAFPIQKLISKVARIQIGL
jgi:hypothetical protein